MIINEGFHVNRPYKNYDFSGLYNICEKIIKSEGKVTPSDNNEMKKQLDKFFTDSHCTNFLVTENTDKFFFGARVYPDIVNVLHIGVMYNILFSEKPIRLSKYSIEFDSKMFSPLVGMTPKEMIAIILHEVGHVVNDTGAIDALRSELDAYCAVNHETLDILKSEQASELLAFATVEYVSKYKSLFNNFGDEFVADEFVHYYGFSDALDSILSKIAKNTLRLKDDGTDPFTTMLWALRIYSSLATRKMIAIKTLKKAQSLTASVLFKRNVDEVLRKFNRVNLISEGALHKFKYNTMKQFEDDYFEIAMRCKNVEEEDDAIYLMRKINTRISIMDDYINTEKISEEDFKKWDKVLNKYRDLREKLLDTAVYKGKQYGVFVNYPDIVPGRYK